MVQAKNVIMMMPTRMVVKKNLVVELCLLQERLVMMVVAGMMMPTRVTLLIFAVTMMIRTMVGKMVLMRTVPVLPTAATTASSSLVLNDAQLQTANARSLERLGAADILPQSAFTPESVADILKARLNDSTWLTSAAIAARSLGRPNAARDLAKLVIKTAK